MSLPSTGPCTWRDVKRTREYIIEQIDDRCINKYDVTFGIKINEMLDMRSGWNNVSVPNPVGPCDWIGVVRPRLYKTQEVDDVCTNEMTESYGDTENLGDTRTEWSSL